MTTEKLKTLELFDYFKTQLRGNDNGQAKGDCPYCNKEDHLYVNRETGQWDCKKCGKKGNAYNFLNDFHERCLKNTKPADYRQRAKDRNLPPCYAKAYEAHGLAKDGNRWLMPINNPDGKLANLHQRREGGNWNFAPSLTLHLLGGDKLRDAPLDVPVYVAEGHEDYIVLSHILSSQKKHGVAVGVPGANTFKEEWAELFKGRTVNLCYDNDDPGKGGMDKAIKTLAGIAAAINRIEWPSDKTEGYDISDHFSGRKDKGAFAALEAMLEEVPLDTIPQKEDGNGQPSALKTRCYADIESVPVNWFWDKRIPFGKLSLIAGVPGVGKTFLSCDLVSRASTGGKFPDGAVAPLCDSLIVSAEDSPEDTLRPRLESQGCDMKRVEHLDFVTKGKSEQSFSLTEHIAALDDWLKAHPKTKVVIIDPITAFMGSVDSHKNTDVRRVLGPLATIADKHGVAVIGVTHLPKGQGQGQRAIDCVIGSIAFIAAARVAWMVGWDPNQEGRRFFIPIKNNLAKCHGLAFTLTDKGKLQWESEAVTITADELFKGDIVKPRDTAKDLLRDALKDGPLPSKRLYALAEQGGITERTLDRAKAELNIKSKKTSAGWDWSLPKPTKT